MDKLQFLVLIILIVCDVDRALMADTLLSRIDPRDKIVL